MNKSARNEIVTVVLSMALVIFAGVAGYMLIEGWNFLDAIYMTAITVATIGYGETHPLSDAGRIFTMFLIFGGLGIAAYSFSTMAALLIDGHLKDAFRRRKMLKKISQLQDHYIICGAGRTGMSIAEELKKTGRACVIIDNCQETVQNLVEQDYLAFAGDATEDDALKKAGAEKAAGIFCCTKNDKDNAFCALTAKILNPKARIITTQRDPSVREKLLRSGADLVVNPGHIGGLRMVSEMVRPATVGFLDLMLRDKKSNYRFEDVAVPQGISFGEIKQKISRDCAMPLAVRKEDGSYIINPADDLKLEHDCRIVVLGDSAQVARFTEKIK